MEDAQKWMVRIGKVEDAQTIASFQEEMASESEGTRLEAQRVLAGVRACLGDPARGMYLVALDSGGKAVGSLLLTSEWSDWNNAEYWWIQSVYVRPEYRLRGVFRALEDEVTRLARNRGVNSLRLYADHGNLPALECYRCLGFRPSHYVMLEKTL